MSHTTKPIVDKKLTRENTVHETFLVKGNLQKRGCHGLGEVVLVLQILLRELEGLSAGVFSNVVSSIRESISSLVL
jgi:hypothetical protein